MMIFLGLEPLSTVIILLTLIIKEVCIEAPTLILQMYVVSAELLCGFTNCQYQVLMIIVSLTSLPLN